MAKRAKPEAEPKPAPKAKGRPKGSGLVLAGVPRVNLLPPSEIQRRAAGALVRRWVAGLVATALVVSGLVAAAYWQRSIAAAQLAAEQARTMELNGELASLSHISQALATRTELTDLRAQAMGNDLEWRGLFTDLVRTLPAGTTLTGFELTTGANPVADADQASGVGLIGRLTVRTDDPADQNRMVDQLRALSITLAADAGSLTSVDDDKGFDFIVEVVVNQAHYSGDHLPEGGPR
ncbi:MAG: hypothetical protein LCH76_01390 [Actinobacteria bacterium]|nr:hypothetical protein [Actinomycetota bacterium]